MPDRELPEHLKAELDDELTSGAPLVAPLASQARYASSPVTMPSRHVSWGLVSAAAATAALIGIAAGFGPAPARQWIGRSVDSIANTVEQAGGHSPSATPSPVRSPEAESTQAAHESPHESPEPAGSPEPAESPEPSQSPESQDSPEPSQSPESHESPEPSQSPEPGQSPEPTGDGDGGGD